MSRYIDAERIKLLMKQDRLLQGNCEYELWKQEVDRQVNALPYIELDDYVPKDFHDKTCEAMAKAHQAEILELTADRPQGEWIPCSERLPEDIRPVLVTWKNTDPASYYQYIVGKHFIGTAHYHRDKWYWYSSVTEDLLAEYGKCDSEEFDEAIEAVAWMPLPEPYTADTPQTEREGE